MTRLVSSREQDRTETRECQEERSLYHRALLVTWSGRPAVPRKGKLDHVWEECKGDLFASQAQALVNPVNCVGVMGAGLAKQFSKRYPTMLAVYRSICRKSELEPGTLLIYERLLSNSPRWIVNTPTKRHWRDPSLIEDVDKGLQALREWVVHAQVQSLAIPALGAGLGALPWAQVSKRVHEHLHGQVAAKVQLYLPHRML